MILSDASIQYAIRKGKIKVDPFDPTLIQPASIDLRLGFDFQHIYGVAPIDVKKPIDHVDTLRVEENGAFTILPGEFVLATTLERVTIPDDLVGRLDGRSSIGRIGLTIHSTAGFIDSGFSGQITLEMCNLLHRSITLYPRMRIAQLSFEQLTSQADKPYGSAGRSSKYQHQESTTASRIHLDFTTEVR